MEQTKKQPKSFLEIIKENPSRKDELLAAAALISAEQEHNLAGDDEIDDADVAGARKKTDVTLDQKNWPVVVIPVTKMNRFIVNQTTGNGDLLIFYLATYKNQRQVDRYNRRNGTTFSLSDLNGRPTVLLQSFSNRSNKDLRRKLADIGRICPPPPGDCY